jgi:hypothetical protein
MSWFLNKVNVNNMHGAKVKKQNPQFKSDFMSSPTQRTVTFHGSMEADSPKIFL